MNQNVPGNFHLSRFSLAAVQVRLVDTDPQKVDQWEVAGIEAACTDAEAADFCNMSFGNMVQFHKRFSNAHGFLQPLKEIFPVFCDLILTAEWSHRAPG